VAEQQGGITIGPMSDPMLGRVVRGYVIRHKLAEGGMGAVYVATHERLETKKVIKILLPVYARHPVLRDRFEREALAVSRLRHKHIVTIDDYGQLPDGQLFLMMPFLEGRPLDAYLVPGSKCVSARAERRIPDDDSGNRSIGVPGFSGA
jgi:serine/threonine protein kinase